MDFYKKYFYKYKPFNNYFNPVHSLKGGYNLYVKYTEYGEKYLPHKDFLHLCSSLGIEELGSNVNEKWLVYLEKNNNVVVQVREIQEPTNRYLVHLFNITDKVQKADYTLKDLGIPKKQYACFFEEKLMTSKTIDRISLDLGPFSTHLIFLQQTPIMQLPVELNF